MVAVGFVTKGSSAFTPPSEVLGVLYGAGAVASLDQNRIFARWLQKRCVINIEGQNYEAHAAFGPDSQLIKFPESARDINNVSVVLHDHDGITTLARSDPLKLRLGRAYTGIVPN